MKRLGGFVDSTRYWSYNPPQTVGDRRKKERPRSVLLTIHHGAWYHTPAKSQPQAGILFTKVQENLISANDFRVNEGIRVPEVRLIGPNGENIGVVSMKQALQIARDAEMDVVEVSPNAAPPVCRVMDFGKFIY